MTEWRPVPGWPRYEASADGRVRSIERTRFGPPPRVLKSTKIPNGYWSITLCRADERKQTYVHRVVCMAFHGLPPTPKHEVAHFDGNKDNNAATNLRWVTKSENREDSRRLGTLPVGTTNGNAKLTDKHIEAIRALAGSGFHQRDLSKIFGIGEAQLSRIVTRKRWNHI